MYESLKSKHYFQLKIIKNPLTSSTTVLLYKRLHVSTLKTGHHQAHVQIKSSNAVVDGIPSSTHL